MKLQAIKTLCVEVGKFAIINTPSGHQWIGNGSAFYPVEGIRLTKESLPALFDLQEKQVREFTLGSYDMDDLTFALEPLAEGRERPLQEEEAFVWSRGELYRVLSGRDGILLINQAYIKPARNKEDRYQFCERDYGVGGSVVAVYGDMLCSALIWPISTKGTEDVMSNLARIAAKPARSIFRAEEKEGVNAESQASMPEEETEA